MALPVEVELSLGMRRYLVLITRERGELLIFWRELGRYVMLEPKVDDELRPFRRSTHEVPSREKGKQHLTDQR